MLRRVLLALLMLLVAIPASAMPLLHGESGRAQTAAMHCHETAPRKSHSPDGIPMAQHDGICCAAFYGEPAAALSSMPHASPAPRRLAMDGHAQPRAGPDSPPPKF